jgi:pimeloyl-ACP methyl ester carboxylesterase
VSDPFDRPSFTESTDGVRLAVYDLGGSGTDVLLVHANGFCAGAWGPVARRLKCCRVTAVDLRGHGRSSRPRGELRSTLAWDGVAEDVLAAVDALGLHRPVGVGHSMGGAALLLSEQRRPDTFAALWLYEPIVVPGGAPPLPPGPNRLSEGARRRRSRFPSAEAALANFASKPPLDELHPDCLRAYVRHGFEEQPDGSVTLRCDPEVEATNFELGGHHGAWEGLGSVSCPTVVARGRVEAMTPSSFAEPVAARLPAGRLEAHDDLGHFGPLEDLDATAASVGALVRASSRAADDPSPT